MRTYTILFMLSIYFVWFHLFLIQALVRQLSSMDLAMHPFASIADSVLFSVIYFAAGTFSGVITLPDILLIAVMLVDLIIFGFVRYYTGEKVEPQTKVKRLSLFILNTAHITLLYYAGFFDFLIAIF